MDGSYYVYFMLQNLVIERQPSISRMVEADIWKKITEPKIEGRNKSYDSGSNGGAPGLSWDDYEVFPLGHPLEEDFTCEVICADGETLICKGSISDRFIRSHSPYDD